MATEVVVRERARFAGASHVLYGVAILGSAFLLFFVQPMVGKRVIPLFGGAPGVWTLCLAFFQSVLFLGYAYAHALHRFVSPAMQLVVHSTLVLAAASVAVVLDEAGWGVAVGDAPTLAILRLLTVHIGLPFFVLASTGPLVQAWYARRHPSISPYPLYALSNAGSFLALFAYPFLVEPRLGVLETMSNWSIGFLVTGALVLVCALMARRGARSGEVAEEVAPMSSSRARKRDATLWLLLSGTAVVVMMSITNHLCRDVASVPFLWILPLAAYLASFVVSFSFEGAYRRRIAVSLVGLALLLGVLRTAMSFAADGADVAAATLLFGLPFEIGRLSCLTFAVCWVLHGELHTIRPRSSELTLYYLIVSAGGAIGGLFVGLAAPWIFSGHGEFAVGAILSVGLVGMLVVAGIRKTKRGSLLPRVLAGLLVASLAGHEVWAAMNPDARQVHHERNFFGVLRVLATGEGAGRQHVLLHGSTTHGLQFVERRSQGIPTSYYGRGSVLAAALTMRPIRGPARIGVVGLGIGTIAAYGQRGDLFRFYEIDPGVVRVAQDPAYFTFLENSRARVEIEVGDARMLLEEEQTRGEEQAFDLLLVDAFSSDAIPVHLMTVEGFAPYVAALGEDGLLLVHLSSRHFDLGPVVARIAAERGLASLIVDSVRMPGLQTQGARWAVLARDEERLATFRQASARLLAGFGLPPLHHRIRVLSPEALGRTPLWTDDYSDLFGALR